MSVLSQFAAGGIKSVQRGIVTPTTANQNVTIPSAVNVNKAFLSVSVKSGAGTSAGYYVAITALALLVNSTTIQIQTGLTPAVFPTLAWEIVEFY